MPLLFFCVLPFLDWAGCWTASFTASSQKPMLELWVSPQILLESEPQLVQELVFTDPHTELLRAVCDESEILLLTDHGKSQLISSPIYLPITFSVG